jgi:hypothetical protein
MTVMSCKQKGPCAWPKWSFLPLCKWGFHNPYQSSLLMKGEVIAQYVPKGVLTVQFP